VILHDELENTEMDTAVEQQEYKVEMDLQETGCEDWR
jgi:hypothetical protein